MRWPCAAVITRLTASTATVAYIVVQFLFTFHLVRSASSWAPFGGKVCIISGVNMSLQRPALAAALIVVAAAAYASAQQSGAVNTLTPAEKKAGWTLLFDGRSL